MSSDLPVLGQEDLRAIARNHVGLILGPALTTSDPDIMQRLRDEIASAFGVTPTATCRETGEAAVSAGAHADRLRALVRMTIQRTGPSPSIRTLSRVRWSAVLSLALDRHFEDGLIARAATALNGRDVSVISHLADEAPPHSVPIYKLLGTCDRDDFVATPADLLRRTPLWSRPIRSFLEAVRASPILCLGLTDSDAAFEILAGHLFASSNRPTRLIFLGADPILQNARLRAILPSGSAVVGSEVSPTSASPLNPNRETSSFPFRSRKRQTRRDFST
jgi:hypothetical protein